jgi:hypothetical protein
LWPLSVRVKALRVFEKQQATSGDRHAVLTALILLGTAVLGLLTVVAG